MPLLLCTKHKFGHTSSTPGLVCNATMALLYTLLGSMVYNRLKYKMVNATMAAARACDHMLGLIHNGAYMLMQTLPNVHQKPHSTQPLTRKPNSAIVSERLTNMEVTPNKVLLHQLEQIRRTLLVGLQS